MAASLMPRTQEMSVVEVGADFRVLLFHVEVIRETFEL